MAHVFNVTLYFVRDIAADEADPRPDAASRAHVCTHLQAGAQAWAGKEPWGWQALSSHRRRRWGGGGGRQGRNGGVLSIGLGLWPAGAGHGGVRGEVASPTAVQAVTLVRCRHFWPSEGGNWWQCTVTYIPFPHPVQVTVNVALFLPQACHHLMPPQQTCLRRAPGVETFGP